MLKLYINALAPSSRICMLFLNIVLNHLNLCKDLKLSTLLCLHLGSNVVDIIFEATLNPRKQIVEIE